MSRLIIFLTSNRKIFILQELTIYWGFRFWEVTWGITFVWQVVHLNLLFLHLDPQFISLDLMYNLTTSWFWAASVRTYSTAINFSYSLLQEIFFCLSQAQQCCHFNLYSILMWWCLKSLVVHLAFYVAKNHNLFSYIILIWLCGQKVIL